MQTSGPFGSELNRDVERACPVSMIVEERLVQDGMGEFV